jgi:hypothetical protein
MELLISRLEKVRNNAEFLANMNQLPPSTRNRRIYHQRL